MQVITDATTLMRKLGAYAYNPASDSELAERLQTMPGSDVDKMFLAMELLNTFRDRVGPAGLELLGQLAAFAEIKQWQIPGQPERIAKLLNGAKRDLGEPGIDQLVEDDPEPVLVYRADGLDWRAGVTPDLEAMKASKRKAVNALKIEHQDSVAPTPFGLVNSDMDSRGKINGLVTMALVAKSMAAPFEQGFTLADDSTVMLDGDMTIGLGVAVGTYISDVHARARVLKDAVDAATTVEELAAIDLAADWP